MRKTGKKEIRAVLQRNKAQSSETILWWEIFMEGMIQEKKLLIHKSRTGYRVIKRLFDIMAAGSGLVVLSPIFLLLAVLIWREDHGPVFFRHMRVGFQGKDVPIFKFRSMRVGAEKLEAFLTEEQLEKYHKEFKLERDPRITKIGDFLRRSSLDELPQLWNILKGDMSVVGPRPIVQEELENYSEEEQRKLLSMKPGLTGYWQAYARNNARYETGERQAMEMYYVENASIWLDVKILFKTVQQVISQDGAQ